MVRTRHTGRAIVVSPERRVLLLAFRFPWRDIDVWITPGGSLHDGEDARAAALRELHEETGLVIDRLGAELWTRRHRFEVEGRTLLQHERYFLLETAEFEPRAVALEAGDEADWFRGFRWWPIEELPDASDRFAPSRLGALLRSLFRDGPPEAPFEVPV